MPLFKGCGCKAKPGKAIDYITDEKKAAIVTSYALDDNRDYARQFAETAQLFHKAERYDSRKYYHFKHSFDPKDNITPEEAHRLTEELAQQAFPDNEYIIATHTDKHHVHCHIIVNSVSFVNGKMLHFSNSDYAKLKDLSNEIAAKYGYSMLDFRKPSADRIKSEERRVILKGGTSWKEELREVIAEALKLCNNMDEFEKHLSKYGVAIARNTAKTISFLHPNKKKPIRGSKLGRAYTKEAINHELTKSGNRRVRAATSASKSTATAITGENSGGNSNRVCPARHHRYEEDERKRRQAYDEQRTAQAKPRKRIR